MSVGRWNSARVGKASVLALAVALAVSLIALINEGLGTPVSAETKARLEASIFEYDGKDFVRTQTTLTTENGKSAVKTKLDHGSPAYKFLSRKESYTGDATVFGHKFEGHYAPVVSGDGRLTGALFVGIPK